MNEDNTRSLTEVIEVSYRSTADAVLYECRTVVYIRRDVRLFAAASNIFGSNLVASPLADLETTVHYNPMEQRVISMQLGYCE